MERKRRKRKGSSESIRLDEIKKLISRVNSTLRYYEPGCSSVKRFPTCEKERCVDFRHFIEARFNFEATKIPELMTAVVATNGNLFRCINLIGEDTSKNRFEVAEIAIIDPKTLMVEDEHLISEINKIPAYFGGIKIIFNSVKVKIKFQILN